MPRYRTVPRDSRGRFARYKPQVEQPPALPPVEITSEPCREGQHGYCSGSWPVYVLVQDDGHANRARPARCVCWCHKRTEAA